MRDSKAAKMIAITAIIMFTVLSMFVYLKNLDSAMREDIIAAMNEVGNHDIRSIEKGIQSRWNSLKNISENFPNYQCETISEVQTRLARNRSLTNFKSLCFIDRDGVLYTDEPLVADKDSHDLLPFFDKYGSMFVAKYNRYNETIPGEPSQEFVLYGMEIAPFMVGDVEFVKIVGICDISNIRDEFDVISFDGRGYSTVINKNGSYVVGYDESSPFSQIKNFYEMLDAGTLEHSETDTVHEQIAGSETFNVSYFYDGTEYEIAFVPFEKANWYFVIMIESSVYGERADRIMTMTAIMFAAVAIVVLAAVLAVYKMSKESMRAQMESKTKGEFLSNMSHEIRTPLNGIIGLNHLMTMHIDNREKLSEYLEKSGRTAQYLLSLLNNILDVSKMQAGKLELDKEPFLIEKVIDNIQTMQHENISSRKINFVVEKDISVPCVRSDEVRIQQVLMNIVSNAAKFTPQDGTITLRAWQTDITETTVTTIFEIEDTGCGMSEEFQKKIFDSFSQERNKIQSSIKGTGLGMAISYLIMQTFGGDIKVRSEIDVGSCFTVTFPAEIADIAEAQTIAAETAELKKASFTILVAEDNELNAEIITEILKSEGHTVEVAQNGQIAVDKFAASENNEFDIILMDVQMPVMDGYTAAKKIRELDRNDAKTVKIFACTANTFKEDRDKAEEAEMDDFLSKPIDISELFEKLRTS